MTLLAGSAFVSGGGSGIGRAIAQALAVQGAAVGVFDLLPEGGKEAVAAIATKGGRATFVQGDVSRWDDVDRGIAASVRELGPLGIMVNAAGVLDGYASAEEIAPALWERVIGINLTGTFFGSKRALAEMLPRARGRIINIASVAGLVGSGGGAAYTASKHGVVGLTRCTRRPRRSRRAARIRPAPQPAARPGQTHAGPGLSLSRGHPTSPDGNFPSHPLETGRGWVRSCARNAKARRLLPSAACSSSCSGSPSVASCTRI